MSDVIWQARCRRVFALLRDAKIADREERLNLFRWILHDPTVTSTNDLDTRDLEAIMNLLAHWQRNGELEINARQHTGAFR